MLYALQIRALNEVFNVFLAGAGPGTGPAPRGAARSWPCTCKTRFLVQKTSSFLLLFYHASLHLVAAFLPRRLSLIKRMGLSGGLSVSVRGFLQCRLNREREVTCLGNGSFRRLNGPSQLFSFFFVFFVFFVSRSARCAIILSLIHI